MIRVDVSLVPNGDESRIKHLGTLDIANFGGDSVSGEYRYRIDGKPWSRKAFKHLRAEGFWKLVKLAFKAVNPL